MRSATRLLSTAAILAASIAATSSPAEALSCLPAAAPKDAAEKVDLLFSGTAVAQVAEETTRFKVETVYLGEAGDYVTIQTPGHPWDFEYELGQPAAVAAHRHDGAYYAGPCAKVKGGPDALIDWLERQ